jgi:hypothetical protein
MSGEWIRAPSCDAGKGDRFPVRKLDNKREAPAHLFDRPSQCREVHVGALLDGGHLLTPRDFANFSCVSSRAWRISCTPNGTKLMRAREVSSAADALFGGVDDTIREAVQMAVGRKLCPETVRPLRPMARPSRVSWQTRLLPGRVPRFEIPKR